MKKFTLIELLVVLAIIGILTAILLPAISGARDEAKKTQVRAHIKQIEVACKAYVSEFGTSVIAIDNEQDFNDSARIHLKGSLTDGTLTNWRGKEFYETSKPLKNPWNKSYYLEFTDFETFIIWTEDDENNKYTN